MEEGIEALFRAYSAMVFRVCMRYTGNREEAEDLTQEVFLRVDRGLRDFSERSATSTWIYRIAINACLDRLRERRRRGETVLEELDAVVGIQHGGSGDRELARVDLERLLAEVKPEVREFLLLTQGEGLSYEEAAAVTGKKAMAIAKAVSRFRRAMGRRKGFLAALGLGQDQRRSLV